MIIRQYDFTEHGDERGKLVAIEALRDIPFSVQRVYYLYDTVPDAVRGAHAHRSLQQILICVNGSCKLLLDDGTEKQTLTLDSPSKGIYISHNIWREIYDFAPHTVLLVLASEHYNEKDYIRNYDAFLKTVAEGSQKQT